MLSGHHLSSQEAYQVQQCERGYVRGCVGRVAQCRLSRFAFSFVTKGRYPLPVQLRRMGISKEISRNSDETAGISGPKWSGAANICALAVARYFRFTLLEAWNRRMPSSGGK